MNNFRYALVLAQTLYDIPISDEDLAIEIGLIAYNQIGNKSTILKRMVADVDCKTGIVDIPCNVNLIEAVTYCGEDWNYTSNIHDYGDVESHFIENYIEAGKMSLDPYYQSGSFVKFKKVGNKLYVNKGLGKVFILYHDEVLDSDGLPELNDKEALAIAEYIAYTHKYKEALKTNNGLIMQIANDLKLKWLFHCDAARVPEHMTQNDADAILNAVSTANRKVHGKSFKPTL